LVKPKETLFKASETRVKTIHHLRAEFKGNLK
jgi:hypothetical protein